MFDHVGFQVRDIEKSKTFFEKALAPLGVKLIADLKEYGAAGFGHDRPQFWLGKGNPRADEDEIHVCFAAKNRAEVNAFYDAAITAGGKDNGKPGLRPEYHQDYYGAFVFDPDGHNIEVSSRKPE
jgi:catechol 2,3-dioxygenase-like lactoylglutathione lyase family enzyme